jgi:hypothetical protein
VWGLSRVGCRADLLDNLHDFFDDLLDWNLLDHLAGLLCALSSDGVTVQLQNAGSVAYNDWKSRASRTYDSLYCNLLK